jgi:hypothetical protein
LRAFEGCKAEREAANRVERLRIREAIGKEANGGKSGRSSVFIVLLWIYGGVSKWWTIRSHSVRKFNKPIESAELQRTSWLQLPAWSHRMTPTVTQRNHQPGLSCYSAIAG